MRAFLVAVLLGLSVGFQGPLHAEDLPRWEMGIGLGGLYLPDYRGSNEQSGYVVPLPYLIYRSDFVNVDREGVRGTLLGWDRVRLDISAALDIPVNSDQNEARAGMPDLDSTFEIGPALEVRLWEGATKNRLTLNLPLRVVIATDLAHYDSLGWVFAPYFSFTIPWPTRDLGDIEFSFGPSYASHHFHDYYYGVEPQYATPQRPTYEADSGYSGSRYSIGVSRRVGDIWFGVFARYDDLSGAVFINSPLVKQDHAVTVGGGIAYVFAKSQETVKLTPGAIAGR